MMRGAHANDDSQHVRFTSAQIAQSLASGGPLRRRRMLNAAEELVHCLQASAGAGQVPLATVINEPAAVHPWKQYQGLGANSDSDVAGALHYFYHAHSMPGLPREEHGHFHLFVRLGINPAGMFDHTHLVAIGVDARGLPLRMFTLNRWVTDETWTPSHRLIAMAEQIATQSNPQDTYVERWLRAQIGMFAPQIAGLLLHRDRRICARQQHGQRRRLLEDRRINILSQCKVSIERQLTALTRQAH